MHFQKKSTVSFQLFVKNVDSSTSIWTVTLVRFSSSGLSFVSGGRGVISFPTPLIYLPFWNFGSTNSLYFSNNDLAENSTLLLYKINVSINLKHKLLLQGFMSDKELPEKSSIIVQRSKCERLIPRCSLNWYRSAL